MNEENMKPILSLNDSFIENYNKRILSKAKHIDLTKEKLGSEYFNIIYLIFDDPNSFSNDLEYIYNIAYQQTNKLIFTYDKSKINLELKVNEYKPIIITGLSFYNKDFIESLPLNISSLFTMGYYNNESKIVIDNRRFFVTVFIKGK